MNYDKIFTTKCKDDFKRVVNYIKNNKGLIMRAIGDDWHCHFAIIYRYNKHIMIDNYGRLREVD